MALDTAKHNTRIIFETNFARYNSPQTMTRLIRLLLIVSVLVPAAVAATSSWTAPAAAFAHRIANVAGPGPATLTVENDSPLSSSDVTTIRDLILQNLASEGVIIRDASTTAPNAIRIIFSSNPTGLLWIAQIAQGPQTLVVMQSLPLPESAPPAHSAPLLTLRTTRLLALSSPILDVATIDLAGVQTLVVLTPSAIILFQQSSGTWQQIQSLPVTHNNVFPRDIRGRIALSSDHFFDAYLPGAVCSSTTAAPVSIACRDSDDPWPLGSQSAFFNSARNYFTGVLVPGLEKKQFPPFYTAAALQRSTYLLWLFAGIDGKVVSFDGINQRTLGAVTVDWGSDFAVVHSTCGSDEQLLVTASSDDLSTDSLRAYEIPDREPIAVSSAIAFGGPITALWTNADASSAIAVVHNLQTDIYEAYSVSVACNQ